MEHLKIGNIIELENNKEYVVTAITKKNNFNYLYLVTLEEPYEVKFVKEIINNNNIDLETVYKKEEKEELLELFQKELSKQI